MAGTPRPGHPAQPFRPDLARTRDHNTAIRGDDYDHHSRHGDRRLMDRAVLLQDIADAADDLTNAYDHVERLPYWDHNRHKKYTEVRTRRPPLIDQICEYAYPGMTREAGSGGTAGHPSSKPPGDWEAVACHASISVGGVKWAVRLGIEVRDTLAGNIRGLVGAAPAADSDTQHDLRRELRSWLVWAQTVAGWRTPPMIPVCPCPLLREDSGQPCGAMGSIRVRFDDARAVCLACKGTWDAATIGLLAETVRAFERASAVVAELARLRATSVNVGPSSASRIRFPAWVR